MERGARAQILQKLIDLNLFTGCFLEICLHSSKLIQRVESILDETVCIISQKGTHFIRSFPKLR